MPLFGPPNVERLKEKGDVEGLVKATRNKDDAARLEAATALQALNDPRAVDGFLSLLTADDPTARAKAAAALGDCGDSEVVEALVEVLRRDEARDVRSKAALALGTIGDPRAVRAFIEEVQRYQGHLHRGDRANVLPALERIPDAADHVLAALKEPGWADETRDWLVTALSSVAGGRVEAFIEILRNDPSESARFRAAMVLIDLHNEGKDARVTEALVKALGDSYDYVWGRAMTALGEKKDSDAFEPLIKALRADDASVRWRAAKVLGELGDPRAVDSLVSALEDDDEDVRLRATEALEALGWQPAHAGVDMDRIRRYIRDEEWHKLPAFGEAAVDPIIEALGQATNNLTVIQAAQALATIGSQRALPALTKLLERAEEWPLESRSLGPAETAVATEEHRRFQRHLREAIADIQGADRPS